MNPERRIVTKMPLSELWDEAGVVCRQRGWTLDSEQIRELLKLAPIQFVIADPGLKLEWIPVEKCFKFWKQIKTEIAAPNKPIYLDQFPHAVAYSASEWSGREGQVVILLERHH